MNSGNIWTHFLYFHLIWIVKFEHCIKRLQLEPSCDELNFFLLAFLGTNLNEIRHPKYVFWQRRTDKLKVSNKLPGSVFSINWKRKPFLTTLSKVYQLFKYLKALESNFCSFWKHRWKSFPCRWIDGFVKRVCFRKFRSKHLICKEKHVEFMRKKTERNRKISNQRLQQLSQSIWRFPGFYKNYREFGCQISEA